MNYLNELISRVDAFQQRHVTVGFPYAVIKKYGEDQAGYQAALLTYYGFLSLFPLLIVLITAAGLVARANPGLHSELLRATRTYFPSIGDGLESSVRGLHSAGLTLLVSLLFTFYGTRGVADAFRHVINHIWHTPLSQQVGFPRSLVRSFSIIIVGGGGFLLAALLAGVATAGSHLFIFRLLSLVINLVILSGTLLVLVKLGLPPKKTFRDIWVGVLIASIGLELLQTLGGYVITHELANLRGAYGNFALVLGLLFWLYLQAQILVYALEVDTVRINKLWPRSLQG